MGKYKSKKGGAAFTGSQFGGIGQLYRPILSRLRLMALVAFTSAVLTVTAVVLYGTYFRGSVVEYALADVSVETSAYQEDSFALLDFSAKSF